MCDKTIHSLYGDIARWNRGHDGPGATVRRTRSEEGAAIIANRFGGIEAMAQFMRDCGYTVHAVEPRPQRPRVLVHISSPTRTSHSGGGCR